MAGRRTNLALLALLFVAFVTGGLAYGIGTGWNEWVVIAHAVVGMGIVLLAPWKSIVVRRGLRRERSGRGASLLLMGFVTSTIVAGVMHSAGLSSLGPVTAMQMHVGAAVAALIFGVRHVVTRRVRVHKTDVSRRSAIRAMGLLGSAGAIYAATEGLWHVTGALGAERRFTGSHEQGSGDPDGMPVTQWFNDVVPDVSIEEWSLRLPNGELTYDELYRYDDRVTAVLDCTGGWFARQEWAGVKLARLLPEGIEARSIRVESLTGYARRIDIGDLDHLLLATRVGGERLSPGHGYPVRLVAPGRRGFWWVKWVAAIEPSLLPEWVQLPFPVS